MAVLDQQMPGTDGASIARALRRRGAAPLIYLLTAFDLDPRLDVAPCDRLLIKPCSPGDLGAWIARDVEARAAGAVATPDTRLRRLRR